MSWSPNACDFSGKTIIVTGASSGIGLEAARIFAQQGGNVIAAVRNREKADKAIDFTAEIELLDLADLASVRTFAAKITSSVDILVNNAGVMAIPLARTKDGFEMQIGTNHLGHFALTNLLLPRITDRVVTVSSSAHRMGKIRLGDLNWEQGKYQKWLAYGQSKLANLLFTSELQKRLSDSNSQIRALAVHPGYANTDLQKSGKEEMSYLTGLANKFMAQSSYMGSLPTVFAASEEIPGNSYVGPDGFGETRGWPTLVKRSAAAQDETMAKALWDLSEKLTGVRYPL